jgi:hypothetical protein
MSVFSFIILREKHNISNDQTEIQRKEKVNEALFYWCAFFTCRNKETILLRVFHAKIYWIINTYKDSTENETEIISW